MDTIPDQEFIAMFRRTARYVNMRNIYTKDEFQERLKKIQMNMMRRSKEAKNEYNKRRFWNKGKLIYRLISHGFPRRVIEEARANPFGFIANTLKYGYKRAVEMKLEEKKLRINR